MSDVLADEVDVLEVLFRYRVSQKTNRIPSYLLRLWHIMVLWMVNQYLPMNFFVHEVKNEWSNFSTSLTEAEKSDIFTSTPYFIIL